MFIYMKSRGNLRLGQIRLSSRSLDQILEKSCVHPRGHSFDPIFMKFCQIINIHAMYYMESRPCLKLGYVGQGCRSLGQIVENNTVHITSKISFTPKFIALRSRLESFEILH